MNNPRRLSVHDEIGSPVSRNPAHRTRKARSIVLLSDKLNILNDNYAIARETVDGLTAILEARAGLMMLSVPTKVLYSKYFQESEPLQRFERALSDNGGEAVLESFLESHIPIYHFEGLLVILLRRNARTIGFLCFDRLGRAPVATDEAALLLLCNQVAALLETRKSLSRSASGLLSNIHQDDMESAAAMQQNLLPSIPASRTCGLAIATHTQSAEFVGGDYFDLLLVDENRMGIVIADVEGKGVPAALFGNMLRTTVHFLARETPSTAALMGKINSILHQEAVILQKLFTMFYSVYDPASKVLTYSGSGHVLPIVIRQNSGKGERLRSDGMHIGIDPIQRFNERSVQLYTDDIIVFFTDGLTEYENEAGQIFGDQRLIALLQEFKHGSVDNIMKAVLSGVAEFTKRDPADDLTIVVAKVL